jgi:hypothetical protein
MKTSIANFKLQIEHRGGIGTCLPYDISQRGVNLKFALCILKFEIRSFAHFGWYYCLHLVGLRRSFGRLGRKTCIPFQKRPPKLWQWH